MRRILLIVLLVVGSVGFDLFVNWYDTRQWSSSSALIVAASALVLGTIAVLVAPHPNSQWRKVLLWVVISTLVISLSFGYGSYNVIGAFVLSLFYLPMSLPFGIVIGFVGSWLLNSRNRSGTANTG